MDYEELKNKLGGLADSPVIAPSASTISNIEKEFDAKFSKSKQMAAEYKKYLPGGHEHQNAIKWPFTVTMKKAAGAKMWDIDGNEFIDYLMASGPIILGHNYPEIRDFIIDLIKENGPTLGTMCEHELLAAKEIEKHYNSINLVRFYQSGTEVGMVAARLARCHTDKDYIIKVGGSYHGWSDQMVYDLHIPGSGPMFAYGIPSGCYEKTLSIKPGKIKRLEKLLKRYNKEGKGGVAAVFLEGGGGDGMSHVVSKEFYHQARELCDKYDALLVCDEVITGFRLAMGGAQEYYGFDADLTMLGKIIGHGYPSAGALAGRRDVMELLGAQAEEVDESGESIKKSVMSAGTLAGTSITCAAAYKAIKCIEKTDAINVAGRAANKICKGINKVFDSHALPFFAYNFNSIIHIATSGQSFYFVNLNKPDALEQIDARRDVLAKYNAMLMLENINSLQAMRGYTSLAHDDKSIQETTINAFDNFCNRLLA